jgi:hypothetical protein
MFSSVTGVTLAISISSPALGGTSSPLSSTGWGHPPALRLWVERSWAGMFGFVVSSCSALLWPGS